MSVENEVREIVADITNVDSSQILLGTSLETILAGYTNEPFLCNSKRKCLIQISKAVEGKYGFLIAIEQMEDFETFGDIVSYINSETGL